ncbi:hypothetical protein OCOJLMKI_2428 [Methylobacterium iners]|uniref:Uncharacterized protein n=1 Tax=Methylobacterium iners TaxID=418707 RepID=A0ABQ4RYF5_9HYPH|nr:hypothetical protein OCOJLMKI_2428 [Methylobacterium iners]
MNEVYPPPGYVRLPAAALLATKTWFPQEWEASDPGEPSPPEISGDPLVALIAGGIGHQGEPTWRERTLLQRAEPYISQAIKRLRDALFLGRLAVLYFPDDSGKAREVNQGFWATASANGVIERGWFEPWGSPTASGRRYIEHLFVSEGALSALLSPEPERASYLSSNLDVSSRLRKLGRPPRKQEAVKDKMRDFISREGMPALQALTEEAMKSLFGASRDTCRKARQELATEFSTE